tara:strand:- start:107 stop:607 length:501 start_codon:yes stop_codon:yes gene_type:complete
METYDIIFIAVIINLIFIIYNMITIDKLLKRYNERIHTNFAQGFKSDLEVSSLTGRIDAQSDTLTAHHLDIEELKESISSEITTRLNLVEIVDRTIDTTIANKLAIDSINRYIDKQAERIDSANKLAEIKKFHLNDAIKQIERLSNRVNELELSQEDSTLTILPRN